MFPRFPPNPRLAAPPFQQTSTRTTADGIHQTGYAARYWWEASRDQLYTCSVRVRSEIGSRSVHATWWRDDTRQTFRDSVYAQTMQKDPSEFSRVSPATSDRQLHLRLCKRCREIIGIGECSHSAGRHLDPRQKVSPQRA